MASKLALLPSTMANLLSGLAEWWLRRHGRLPYYPEISCGECMYAPCLHPDHPMYFDPLCRRRYDIATQRHGR